MKFKGEKKYLVCVLLILSFFFIVNFSSAAFLKDDMQGTIGIQAADSAASSYDVFGDIYTLVQTVINAFLALVGVILLAYLLYAGYKWMTAHGEEEKVTQAKDTIQRAIIGIIIIVAAYAISIFVMSRLEAGTLRDGGGTPTEKVIPPALED